MPRRLVDDSQLSRAVALRQSGSQLVSIVGGPVGGLVVAAAGFAAAAWADSATFAIVPAVLILIRGRAGAPPRAPHRNVVRDAADGVRIAVRTPGLGAALLLVAGSAGFIIPVSSLLIPLLARTHGWGAGAAGLVSHLSPVLLGTAPRSHLARVQALLSLVQSLTLLATNNIIGWGSCLMT